MHLITHLRVRERAADMSGIEAHVLESLRTGDSSWFPVQKAMCLDRGDEEAAEAAARRQDIEAVANEARAAAGCCLVVVLHSLALRE